MNNLPKHYTEEEKQHIQNIFSLGPHLIGINNATYFYTDIDNDEIRDYVFETEKMVPTILEKEELVDNILDSIDLISLAQELKAKYEQK